MLKLAYVYEHVVAQGVMACQEAHGLGLCGVCLLGVDHGCQGQLGRMVDGCLVPGWA